MRRFAIVTSIALVLATSVTFSHRVCAQDSAEDLVSYPSLFSQLNYDGDIGPTDDGERYTLNIQPVLSFSLNDDWNMILRTIIPLVDQKDIFPEAGSQSGIGDIV